MKEVCDDAGIANAEEEPKKKVEEVRNVTITMTGKGKKGGSSSETMPPPPPAPIEPEVVVHPVTVKIASTTAGHKRAAVGDSLKKRLTSSLRNKLSDSFL